MLEIEGRCSLLLLALAEGVRVRKELYVGIHDASGRCSYHLVAESYHPLGRHLSTLALLPPIPQE